MALTPVIMKCSEKLVHTHITSSFPSRMDPHQFAYRANRSTEDPIVTALHTALIYLERQGSYVRLLFVDFSSAFNITWCQSCQTCTYITQSAYWSKSSCGGEQALTSLQPSVSALAPPRLCAESSALHPMHPLRRSFPPQQQYNQVYWRHQCGGANLCGNETAYLDKVEQLSVWSSENNLVLNTSKTKELIMDYKRKKTDMQPLLINGECVVRVSTFQFLGVRFEYSLTWSTITTTLIKKAQQRLHFLRILRGVHLTQKLRVSFYHCSIENILAYCTWVWFASYTAAEGAPRGQQYCQEDHRQPSPLPEGPVKFPLPQKSLQHP